MYCSSEVFYPRRRNTTNSAIAICPRYASINNKITITICDRFRGQTSGPGRACPRAIPVRQYSPVVNVAPDVTAIHNHYVGLFRLCFIGKWNSDVLFLQMFQRVSHSIHERVIIHGDFKWNSFYRVRLPYYYFEVIEELDMIEISLNFYSCCLMCLFVFVLFLRHVAFLGSKTFIR